MGQTAKRMAESVAAVKAIFGCWEGKELGLPREFYYAHFDATNFNPGLNPYGPPPVCWVRSDRSLTRTAGGGRRWTAGDAVQQHPAFTERTIPALTAGLDRSGRRIDDP